jgi:hypothetical protein
VARDELFLLGNAEGDEQHVRLGMADALDDLVFGDAFLLVKAVLSARDPANPGYFSLNRLAAVDATPGALPRM